MLIPIKLMQALMEQCRGEPHGAYPKGTRVMKVKGDALDVHALAPRG